MDRSRNPALPVAPAFRRFMHTACIRVVSAGCMVAAGLGSVTGCAANGPSAAAGTAPARAAVVAFLDAVKRGDDAAARSMLTKLARTKTTEYGIAVTPPVNDTSVYTVGDCEIVNKAGDIAHVATVWSEAGTKDSEPGDNIIWVVRLDPEGWRVAGMAMKVFDDLPPLLLDFEDPEDMLAKQERVALELQKRDRQTTSQPPTSEAARTARGGGTAPPVKPMR